MPSPRIATVTEAYQRQYENPIVLKQGERVTTTKHDMWDEKYLWIWCISESGGEGWVPDQFLQLKDTHAITLRDYNAIELTVQEGDRINIHEEANGWYWVENANAYFGWVPIKNVK